MVLAGAVTFSITNAILVDQSSKHLAEESALTISVDPKKANVTNEKTVTDQAPTTNEKAEPAMHEAIENENKSDRTKAVIQQNANKSTEAMSISPAKVTTSPAPVNKNVTTTATPVSATIPATSPKAPTTTTPTSTGTNTTSPTQTTINNGQQVSQDAKEKAAIRQDNKGNNGKNM